MTKRRSKVPPAPPRPKARPARRPIRLVLAIAGFAIAAMLVWQLRKPGPSVPPPRNGAEALARAQAFERAGDLDAALNCYRENAVRFPGDLELLGRYGVAVANHTFAVRTVRGQIVPVVRTSLDRVREAQAALAAYDAAQRGHPQSSIPPRLRGLLYASWGLPEDALVELYAATVRGDTSAAVLDAGAAITRLQLVQAAPEPGR